MTLRIIAVGNLNRRDDGAGILAARAFRRSFKGDIDVVESIAEPASLLTAWGDVDTVIILDASAPAGKPGRIRSIVVGQDPLPKETSAASTHAFGLASALELANALGEAPATTIVLTIEGEDFGYGEGLSQHVAAAISNFVQAITDCTQAIARKRTTHA